MIMYRIILEIMLGNPYITTEEAIEYYFTSRSMEISDEQLLQINETSAVYIESYVRRYFKINAIKSIAARGIPVEIYGGGWGCDSDYNNVVHIHNRVSSAECNILTAQAKIALNFMPWYKDGASERVFNNMMAGSLCITDPSGYLLNNYIDGKDIVYFDLNNISKVGEVVEYYLEHTEEAERIAEAGKIKASTNDSWLSRMQTVLQYMDEDGV